MVNVAFSPQEVQALIELLNIAVKAGGLRIAAPALTLEQKLMQAVQQTAEASVQVTEQPNKE